MATLDDIRAEILETAGLASDDARFPDATLTRIVNRALRSLSAEKDWPWNERTESLTNLVGDATFDYTGGASEDLWTLASHGLTVGTEVKFTTNGTGADEYVSGTSYWVVSVPDANTFQLSATLGGSVLEGTADSVGTWTLLRFTLPFGPTISKTIRLVYEDRDLVQYQARDSVQYVESFGTPHGYFVEADRINLVPPPDGVYTIFHAYVAYETALSADSDTPRLPDRYLDWLVQTALIQVSQIIRDETLYAIADREAKKWFKRAVDEFMRTTATMRIQTRNDWWV